MNHILFLIDDDADDRFMFEEALQNVASHCIYHAAENGQEALSMLNSGTVGLPQIILLDVNMPVFNGWQCLSELKKDDRYKKIPVIMYSTSSYQEDIEKALKMGALCFFTKPSDFETLEKILCIVVKHLDSDSIQILAEGSDLFMAN